MGTFGRLADHWLVLTVALLTGCTGLSTHPGDDVDAGPDAGADAGEPADAGGDAGTGEDAGGGCGSTTLLCNGNCSPCPTGAAVSSLGCAGAQCVATACTSGYHRCVAGCCAWRIEVVDGTLSAPNSVGLYNSLALDDAGVPHVSYYARSSTTRALKYATLDGGVWQLQTVESVNAPDAVGSDTSLALDPAGHPAISYLNAAYGTLKLARWNGAAWSIEPVLTLNFLPIDNSLAFDSAGVPLIAFYDFNQGRIRYGTRSASGWSFQPVNLVTSRDLSLRIDSTDRPQLTFRETNVPTQLVFTRFTGASWSSEIVEADPQIGAGSLALDPQDNAHVAYYQGTLKVLRYASRSAAGWGVPETVDSSAAVGQYASLALDSSGNPHITYFDETNGRLKYAVKVDGAWQIEVVDAAGKVGTDTHLALDPAGAPWITYYDVTLGHLKSAH